ncbi:hypothetical protein [Flavobacterium piscinae]|uniref:hypothetical protein n=1 Tax=Flavobacterium piscinae TaxID=2506424 RepID=UPI002AAAAFB2|nr:hypothetical protein [Flavobacterium piscinae]
MRLFSQDILWEKSIGGKHADYLFDAVPTADYGFLLAGSSLSGKTGKKTDANQGDLDYWLWKMNEHGDLEWQKVLEEPVQTFCKGLNLPMMAVLFWSEHPIPLKAKERKKTAEDMKIFG